MVPDPAPPNAAPAATPPKAASPEVASGSGIDLAGIDRTVTPGDDFFAYANGAWLKSTEI
ncbi:MAG: putative endopeptidase, partial [Myxococcales bacterium]|nr:putative endopeptidase [Myxococcales bacterium]